MKRQILILVCVLMAGLAAFAQEDIVSKCGDIQGVTTVSISAPMLKMAGPRIGDKDISAIAGKMNSIDIITCDNLQAVIAVQKVLDKCPEIVGSQKLIHVNDNGEKVTIKYRPGEKSTTYYLFTRSDSDFTVIIFDGTMTIDEMLSICNN